MKKKWKSIKALLKVFYYSKPFLIMRITVFLLLFSVIQVMGENSYSQNTRLSLNLKDVSIENVLDEIENQSEFYFLFNQKLVNVDRKVDINAKNERIKDILAILFEGENINSLVLDRQILLSPEYMTEKVNVTKDRQQQEIVVTGKVTDKDGNTLPGVTVVLKGTTQGTVTNAEGNYSISNIPDGAILQFSFVGMRTQEFEVGTQTSIDVTLAQESIGLDEVVTIGYGTQKKVNLTGSVSAITEKTMTKKTVSFASQGLAGEVSGLQVRQESGNPGKNAANLTIRGLGTFSSAGNSPLIIVDGVPSSINNLDYNNIESISILKDAASASIYGSRAANGVILITTKNGEDEKFHVNYSAYVGKQSATEMPQYLDSWDWVKLSNEAAINLGQSPSWSEEDIQKFKSGEDPDNYPNEQYYKDFFTSGNGLQTNQSLTFSGGSSNTKYLVSAGYMRQNGIVEQNYFNRYNIRTNLKSDLRDNLRLDVRLHANQSYRTEPIPGGNLGSHELEGTDGLIRQVSGGNPTIPGRKSDGTYGYSGPFAPYAVLDANSYMERKPQHLMGNMSLDWDIFNSLTLSGRISYQSDYEYFKARQANVWINPDLSFGPSSIRVIKNDSRYLVMNSTVDYVKTFGNHNLHILGGVSQESYDYESLEGYRQNLVSEELATLNAASNANMQNSGNFSRWTLRSFFGRFNYSFQEKYLLEINARYDGSSRFSEDERYGLFPSISGGWRISEENFFNIPWINELKIRGSYGSLGNQQIGTYPYQKLINLGQNYPFGNSIQTGAAYTTHSFQDITWESTDIINAGLNLTALEGKLELSTDYFIKKTHDILYNLSASRVLGMGVSEQNAGGIENKGLEFEIVHKNRIGDFYYSVSSNFSILDNKVVKLGNVSKDIGKGLFIGESLGSIYGYETEGLFIDQEDIDNYPEQPYYAEPGLIRYKDISGPDGVPDGEVTAEYDRKVIGDQLPTYLYGLSIAVDYKGFDFYIQFQGEGDYVKIPTGNMLSSQEWVEENRWTRENPDRWAKFPRLGGLGWGQNYYNWNSTYWLLDASYLRIKNIQIGYTLPSNLVSKLSIDNCRIYLAGLNLVTFDKYYKGWDPEMETVGLAGSGYPPTRLISLGINVNF